MTFHRTPTAFASYSPFSPGDTVTQGMLVKMAVSVPMLKNLSYPLSQGALTHHLNFLFFQHALPLSQIILPVDSFPFPLLSLLLWVLWKTLGVTSMTLSFLICIMGRKFEFLWDSNTGLLTSILKCVLWLTTELLHSKCHLGCVFLNYAMPLPRKAHWNSFLHQVLSK